MLGLDSEGTFWLGVCSIVGIIIISVTITVSSYYSNKLDVVNGFINQGMSATEASCALDDYGRMPTCIILATKKSLEKE